MRPITDSTAFDCATCETDAGTWPTFHLGLAFCCAGCAADGPCICSYDPDPIDVDAHDVSEIAPVPGDRILVAAAR